MKNEMTEKELRRNGILLMLGASICFSTGGLFIKLIPWNPLAINGARNLIACLVILGYIRATRHKIKVNPTVLVGAFSMAGVTTAYSIANKLTTAGNTIILQYTAPIWIMVLTYLIFHRKPISPSPVRRAVRAPSTEKRARSRLRRRSRRKRKTASILF